MCKAIIKWEGDEPTDDFPKDVEVLATLSLDDMAEYMSFHWGRLCSLEWVPDVRPWHGKQYNEAYGN